MLELVALYRSRTVSEEAGLVAVSAEPQLVRRFVEELLGKPQPERVGEDAAYLCRILGRFLDDSSFGIAIFVLGKRFSDGRFHDSVIPSFLEREVQS